MGDIVVGLISLLFTILEIIRSFIIYRFSYIIEDLIYIYFTFVRNASEETKVSQKI